MTLMLVQAEEVWGNLEVDAIVTDLVAQYHGRELPKDATQPSPEETRVIHFYGRSYAFKAYPDDTLFTRDLMDKIRPIVPRSSSARLTAPVVAIYRRPSPAKR